MPVQLMYGASMSWQVQSGDGLWFRETWHESDGGPDYYAADYADGETPTEPGEPWRWRPSIFMPREACRLTARIRRLRLEFLHNITAGDIIAEGVVARAHHDQNLGKCPVSSFDGKMYVDLRSLWAHGWDSINGRRAPWKTNPLVWAIDFERVT